MYAGNIACCPLVSHDEYRYVPRALLMLKKDGTDRRTGGRTDVPVVSLLPPGLP